MYVIYREATITVTRHRGGFGYITASVSTWRYLYRLFCLLCPLGRVGTSLGFFPATSITKQPFVVILFPYSFLFSLAWKWNGKIILRRVKGWRDKALTGRGKNKGCVKRRYLYGFFSSFFSFFFFIATSNVLRFIFFS